LLFISSSIGTLSPTLKYFKVSGILNNFLDGIYALVSLAAVVMMHVVRLDDTGLFCSGVSSFD
jgi:hypothetical protein